MIVIFGYSKLAAQLAESFKIRKYNVVIVEPNKIEREFALKDRYVDKVYDYPCYYDEDLLKIGIGNGEIKTFYCLHNDQNLNLVVTLGVRNLDKNLQIISVAHNKNESKKLKLAGATATINPFETVALKAFRQIHRPRVLKILDKILYGDSNLVIQELKVEKDTLLDGQTFQETAIFEEFNLVLLGIHDIELSNEFIFSSRGINHKIDAEDTLVLLGYKEDLTNFKQYILNTKLDLDSLI